MVSSIGETIGRIWKRWPGYREEGNMDHEYFGLDGKINTFIASESASWHGLKDYFHWSLYSVIIKNICLF